LQKRKRNGWTRVSEVMMMMIMMMMNGMMIVMMMNGMMMVMTVMIMIMLNREAKDQRDGRRHAEPGSRWRLTSSLSSLSSSCINDLSSSFPSYL